VTELIWEGKYEKDNRKVAPLRVKLPFQTVETVNESAQERQHTLDLFSTGRPAEWRNRLIWGDKKYILPSLLEEFSGQVNLIYIDPPFDTGDDFSFNVEIEGEEFTKEPSIIEQKAYRDIWGVSSEERKTGKTQRDRYLQWLNETIILLHELLASNGSIFVHMDWHAGHYVKLLLDEIFGIQNYLNEIIWWYYNKFQGNINHFAADHDVIFWYRKNNEFVFHPLQEKREAPIRQIKRTWDKEKGRIVNVKGEDGKVLYQESTTRTVDDVWRISMLQPADTSENLRYPTQKPEALIERIINAASNDGDLVLDCLYLIVGGDT
jgi:adenine specific DNA methylase Mod